MASAQSIDELLEQPMFIDMVKAISMPQLSRGEELDANLALDALTFVAAMLQEAHPDYAKDEDLTLASTRAGADQLAFLLLLRDHSKEAERHMIEGMAAAAAGADNATDELSRLVAALQSIIINLSNPKGKHVSARCETGAYLAYDLPTVAQALTYVLAIFAAQSGDLVSPKDLRLFADTMRNNFLSTFRQVESQLNALHSVTDGLSDSSTMH